MNLGALIFSLQASHRHGVTNERTVECDGDKWIVRIYDDCDHKELQLILWDKFAGKPDVVLLRCPAWWKHTYAAEVFEMAIKLWTYGS